MKNVAVTLSNVLFKNGKCFLGKTLYTGIIKDFAKNGDNYHLIYNNGLLTEAAHCGSKNFIKKYIRDSDGKILNVFTYTSPSIRTRYPSWEIKGNKGKTCEILDISDPSKVIKKDQDGNILSIFNLA